MSLSTILLLITLVVNMLCIYTVHNSEIKVKVSKWNNEYKYEPFKLPIILWLIILIVMFIPALNIIAAIVHVILLGARYGDETLRLNENFWLAKKL